MMETRIEKYSTGKWDVRTRGDYPRRIGHIVGGRKRYLAEMGPESLGYFPTLKKAASAISGQYGIDERNEAAIAEGPPPTPSFD
jgi:hypothetical protein